MTEAQLAPDKVGGPAASPALGGQAVPAQREAGQLGVQGPVARLSGKFPSRPGGLGKLSAFPGPDQEGSRQEDWRRSFWVCLLESG